MVRDWLRLSRHLLWWTELELVSWSPVCDTSCDNYFLNCLRPYGCNTSSNACSSGNYQTTSVVTLTSLIVRNSQPSYTHWGTWTVSIVMCSLAYQHTLNTVQGAFQFYVKIVDHNSFNNHDLGEKVFVQITSLAVRDMYTSQVSYSGQFGQDNITLQFQVSCDSNHYGPLFATFREPVDNSTGHLQLWRWWIKDLSTWLEWSEHEFLVTVCVINMNTFNVWIWYVCCSNEQQFVQLATMQWVAITTSQTSACEVSQQN